MSEDTKNSHTLVVTMKKEVDLGPGIAVVMKLYHSTILTVLEEKKQTRKEAAAELGISVSTFHKMLRLQTVPKPHTNRGKDLCEALERWSGLPTPALFPEAFFTREFLKAPKTTKVMKVFTLMMNGSKRNLKLLLEMQGKSTPHNRKKKRTRRKKK